MTKFGCCQSTDGDSLSALECRSCKLHYHIQCILPDKSKKVSKDFKSTWVCPNCLSKTRRIKSDSTPVRSGARDDREGTKESPLTLNVACVEKTLAQCSPQLQLDTPACSALDIAELIRSEVSKMKNELSSTLKALFASEISSLKQELRDIKSSMDYMNQEYNKLNTKMDKMEVKIKQCEVVVSDVEALKTAVKQVQNDINLKNQWARRSNIEIFGIPENRSENLHDLVRDLAKRTHFVLMPSDIDFVTRVAPSAGELNKPKPIVLRMLCRSRKDDFLHSLRKLRGLKASDLGFIGKDFPVFFNDHLTKYNKSLLQRVKKIAREKNYKYVWVKNCTIMARCSDTSPVLHVGCEDDLKK